MSNIKLQDGMRIIATKRGVQELERVTEGKPYTVVETNGYQFPHINRDGLGIIDDEGRLTFNGSAQFWLDRRWFDVDPSSIPEVKDKPAYVDYRNARRMTVWIVCCPVCLRDNNIFYSPVEPDTSHICNHCQQRIKFVKKEDYYDAKRR